MASDRAPHIIQMADGRQVGYRRLGAGAPVVLLHASPRSAAALLPLAQRLADRFTVFAFDTPGFGYSDALPEGRRDAWDYGDALIESFDALGIERAPVYGSHTGAAIAVAAALTHSTRVSALALDGYALFTPTEQAEYLANYLAPIEPDWDGAWLAWLWGRVKDQFSFFPWYLRAQSARILRPLPPAAVLQSVVVDFLAAGDAYRPAYAAAFRFPGLATLRDLKTPCTVMARADDLLVGHLDGLTGLPAHVSVQRLPADDAAWEAAVAAALSVGAGGAAPEIPDLFNDAGRDAYAVARVSGGTIGVLRCGGAASRVLVMLPSIPGSARASVDLARALRQPVLVVDLPGFGASLLSHAPDAAAIAAAIAEALQVLGVTCIGVIASGESAAIGAMLAGTARLVLIDPLPDALRAEMANAMADATPRDDGAHLLAAWHQLRDSTLWRPWFARTPDNAIDAGADPDAPRLHAILTDWMRGGVAGRETLQAALAPALADLRKPNTVVIAGVDRLRPRVAAILAALEEAQ